MMTDDVSDETLMGAIDVSLGDLNAAIECLRERGYDVTVSVAGGNPGCLHAVVERTPGQLLVVGDTIAAPNEISFGCLP